MKRNTVVVKCCECGAAIKIGDGYNVRERWPKARPGGWATRHGGSWERLHFVCEPGKLLRLHGAGVLR